MGLEGSRIAAEAPAGMAVAADMNRDRRTVVSQNYDEHTGDDGGRASLHSPAAFTLNSGTAGLDSRRCGGPGCTTLLIRRVTAANTSRDGFGAPPG